VTPSRLADLALRGVALIEHVGGEGSFRRRLMELGLVPGTRVELVGVAPLGDPLELLVRGASVSIRRSEAESIRIAALAPATAEADGRASLEPASARGGQ
jgi:Fe2+ transport system protein FeoA